MKKSCLFWFLIHKTAAFYHKRRFDFDTLYIWDIKNYLYYLVVRRVRVPLLSI